MNPAWLIRTGRLELRPVGWQDLPELRALKADPGVYAQMLGGVRSTVETGEELAEDVRFWGARGVGMWTVRHEGTMVGITGLHERRDGRGTALRFAFWPEARGRGLAMEAAGAALRFAHERAGVERVVAVARAVNIGSRTLLGAIGMREREWFLRGDDPAVAYESLISPRLADAWHR